MRFVPTASKQEWGSDTIMLGDLGYVDSTVDNGWLGGNTINEIMDMFMDRVTGENAFAYYGRQFPVMLSQLDIKGDYPVLVCPDDKVAEQRYDALGKAKLWYVVDAKADAVLYVGFEDDVEAKDLYEAAQNGSVKKLMHKIPARKGEMVFIAPGVVHSATGEVVLAEVAESSGLDINVAEDLVEALDFVELGPYKEAKGSEFRVEKVSLRNPVRIAGNESDYFVAYLCVSGRAAVEVKNEETGNAEAYSFGEGSAVVIPAEVSDYALVPEKENTFLIEVTVPEYIQEDEYINPDVAPTLPGEE